MDHRYHDQFLRLRVKSELEMRDCFQKLRLAIYRADLESDTELCFVTKLRDLCDVVSEIYSLLKSRLWPDEFVKIVASALEEIFLDLRGVTTILENCCVYHV